MLSTYAVFSALTTAALAASSASSTATASPLVPTGISSSCSDFLNQLNANSTMAACTSSLIAATSNYGPGGNASATQSGISSTLSTLCASSTTNSCPDSLIRSTLADFQTACTAELTSNPNDEVVRTYDVVYALVPLKQAMCQKADDGSWCVASSPSASSAPSSSAVGQVDLAAAPGTSPNPDISKYLYVQVGDVSKRDSSAAAVYPNTTTYCQSNLAFDFLQPSLSQADLCTSCTRNILTSYIQFEASSPYAPGLGQSQILCGQPDLLNAVKSTCGDSFLSGGVAAAGSLGNNGPASSPSAGFQVAANAKAVAAIVAGVVAFIAA